MFFSVIKKRNSMTGQTEVLGNDMYKGGGGRAGMHRPGKDNSS